MQMIQLGFGINKAQVNFSSAVALFAPVLHLNRAALSQSDSSNSFNYVCIISKKVLTVDNDDATAIQCLGICLLHFNAVVN